MKNEGSGWHRESKRHSEAAIDGWREKRFANLRKLNPRFGMFGHLNQYEREQSPSQYPVGTRVMSAYKDKDKIRFSTGRVVSDAEVKRINPNLVPDMHEGQGVWVVYDKNPNDVSWHWDFTLRDLKRI